jgi:preprotein translocase subunit Sec63
MYQSKDKVNRTPVLMSMMDGSVMTASIKLPLSNKLSDTLNTSEMFLDVLTIQGEQQFIAKAAIRSVRAMDVPKTNQIDLEIRSAGQGQFEPYAILQVDRNASQDEIRKAYHRMVRLYHPDRISSFDLPDEMMEYARAMLVRINLAFEQLKR